MIGRAALVILAGMLLASVAVARDGKVVGCCVCSDGRCIENVKGMQACSDKCFERQLKGSAYNAGGNCWSNCAKAKAQLRVGGR